jgi:phosphatidylglycerophosphate synthase
VIETALITVPSRANDLIFGRPLLERLLILCEREGIWRFVLETPLELRAATRAALGRFRDDPAVALVDTLNQANPGLDPAAVGVRLDGNLVLAPSILRKALDQYRSSPGTTVSVVSTDSEHGGSISVGPLQSLINDGIRLNPAALKVAAIGVLPFALNGRPEDREEAETRLARAIRNESVTTDALMARALDRRVSWRISLRLARLRVAPNTVTLANTALGFGCAAMLASTSYWLRLAGAVLFLVCITLDGVDGELARLRMVETKFGGRLDVFTDNLVHIAIFAGLMVGCYRVSHSSAYAYLLLILLVGFGICAVTVRRALGVAGEATARWIGQVERATGRDFAYIVVILALVDRLAWFAWSAAIGTYGFALVLWILTSRQLRHTR